MKKALSSSSKLVRKVLTTDLQEIDMNGRKSEGAENELGALRDQINYLQQTITILQKEIESKDKDLLRENKEKERVWADLKKHKQSNLNLKQQLEDERTFYLKEKEYYCKEMTEVKKKRIKQTENENIENNSVIKSTEIEALKLELSKLKHILNETLEANYNLSIKFLRMKNTKFSLKARYKRSQTDNAKVVADMTKKLGDIKEQLNCIISDKFRHPISPSNKKYLQIVKKNTQLIHENLFLQVEITKLHNEIERIKAGNIKFETNSKLQYVHSPKTKSNKKKCSKTCQTIVTYDREQQKSESSTTFSNGKQSDLFSDVDFGTDQCPMQLAVRTHSAPNMGQNDILLNEESVTSINYE